MADNLPNFTQENILKSLKDGEYPKTIGPVTGKEIALALTDLSRRRAQDAKRDAVIEALKDSTKMLSDLQFHLEKVEPQATEGRKYMALQIAKNFRLMHDYEAATNE